MACDYTFDNKKDSFWAHVVAFPGENTYVKPWDEQCISFHTEIMRVSAETPELSDGHYLELSKHAIKRIFERTNLCFHTDNSFHPAEITRLLQKLPNWTAIYSLLAPLDITGLQLFPIFPTDAGLFLGERHRYENGAAITIRTFVSVNQLTARQKLAYDALNLSIKPFLDVPFFLFNATHNESNAAADRTIVTHALSVFTAAWLTRLGDQWSVVRDTLATAPGTNPRLDIANSLDKNREAFLRNLTVHADIPRWLEKNQVPTFKNIYLQTVGAHKAYGAAQHRNYRKPSKFFSR
jgi:hypothetical protein